MTDATTAQSDPSFHLRSARFEATSEVKDMANRRDQMLRQLQIDDLQRTSRDVCESSVSLTRSMRSFKCFLTL